jgi:hypothetical protein
MVPQQSIFNIRVVPSKYAFPAKFYEHVDVFVKFSCAIGGVSGRDIIPNESDNTVFCYARIAGTFEIYDVQNGHQIHFLYGKYAGNIARQYGKQTERATGTPLFAQIVSEMFENR